MVYFCIGHTKTEELPQERSMEGYIMAKRRAKFDAAYKNNKTPKESLPDTEFAQEAVEEEAIKGANRNSKKGYQNGRQE